MSRSLAQHAGAALVLAAAYAAVAAASAAPPAAGAAPAFVWLVVREDCWDTLFGLAFGSPSFVPCAAASISKGLGYGIIAGACLVKVPQLQKIVSAGSVASLNRESVYFELLSNMLATISFVILGAPFSSYGETVIVAAGSLAVLLLVWYYAWPGATHAAGVAAAMAAACAVALRVPLADLHLLQLSTFALFAASRGAQMWETAKAGSVGALSPITLTLNFVGTAARIFTSLKEVNDATALRITVVNTLLNGGVLAQYVYYSVRAGGAPAAGGKRDAAAVVAPAAAGDDAPPSSGARRSSRRKQE
jgi:mannose-P-dolichol utilization defect protein 1